jgi:hypothetical protein
LKTWPILLSSTLLLAGCIPFPHRAVATPPVSGVVTLNDQPLASASVLVCDATEVPCCEGRKQRGLTDTEGRFSVPPVEKTRWFLYVMAHRNFQWCLAVEEGGVRRTAGPFSQYTLMDSGPALEEAVACTLANDTLTCTGARLGM